MASLNEKGPKHYNDWPNTQGFDTTYQEKEPVELKIVGKIPAYATGTLFRTGLGVRDVKTDAGTTYRVNHWFDNLAQVHRFQIHAPEKDGDEVRVTYNSRSTCDGLIKRIKETGKREEVTFGAKYDPCMSIFHKMSSVFKPARLGTKPEDFSNSVTLTVNFPGLSKSGMKMTKPHEKDSINTLCNKSDNDVLQMLDPETLEPVGIAWQKTLHPDLKGPVSATHAEVDPETGDLYNFNLDFGKGAGVYRIFSVSASTGKTNILATFQSEPAYIHSLFQTKNYIVFCVWNSMFSCGGASILWNKNISDSIAPYNSTRRCKWFVIDKTLPSEGGKGHIASYDSDPFFCFHTVNAYEETDSEGNKNIVADLTTYPDLDIIKRMYIDNIISNSATTATWATQENCMATLRRFTLPSIPKAKHAASTSKNPKCIKAISGFKTPLHHSPELPTISPLVKNKKHKYVYGVVHSGKSSLFEALIKVNVEDGTAITWEKHAHTAGEPIFVPNPEGTEEDDGVLLSVVLDGPGGNSYLIVLDARDLKEVGRANVNGVIGFGFHGTFTK